LPLDRVVLVGEDGVARAGVVLDAGLPEDGEPEPILAVLERNERGDCPAKLVADTEAVGARGARAGRRSAARLPTSVRLNPSKILSVYSPDTPNIAVTCPSLPNAEADPVGRNTLT